MVHLLLTGGVIQLYRLIFLDLLHSVVNDLGTNFHDLSDLSGMLDRMSHHSDIFVSTTLRMTGYIIARVMVCSMDSRTPIILVVSILRVFDWSVLTQLFHQLSHLIRIFHIIIPAIFLWIFSLVHLVRSLIFPILQLVHYLDHEKIVWTVWLVNFFLRNSLAVNIFKVLLEISDRINLVRKSFFWCISSCLWIHTITFASIYHICNIGIFFLLVLTLVPTAFAHQPRITNQWTNQVIDPEISKAYYAQLPGEPQKYIIEATGSFNLYVNILVPDIIGQKKDVTAIIFKNGDYTHPIITLGGLNAPW